MNTPQVPTLIEILANELERPRKVSGQVVNHVIGTYNINRDDLGAFLTNELPKLEDYEIDLILSPLFTPLLCDQAVIAELLGDKAIPSTEWPALIQQLTARSTRAQLVTEDDQTHSVSLRDVTIERYVHRLRLDATIPKATYKLLNDFPASDKPLLKAIARRAIWGNDARRNILIHYLTSATSSNAYRLDDALELLKLVETYEPADVNDLLARIPHWLQVLQQEINEGAGTKPFFNERVEELHGGGRDQRRQDNTRITTKENERAFLERLQQVLNTQR